jgi:phenylpyruvate tautomerase PptA (4-oxalocrotonate tautomerase family)
MPTYQIAMPAGTVPRQLWPRIAEQLTQVHCSLTGDAPDFAQVIFLEIPPGAVFSNGRPSPMVNVAGYIRAGRTAEIREKWLQQIHSTLTQLAAIPEENIKITLFDVPARWIMQAGRMMPEPGCDQEWLAQGKGRAR